MYGCNIAEQTDPWDILAEWNTILQKCFEIL